MLVHHDKKVLYFLSFILSILLLSSIITCNNTLITSSIIIEKLTNPFGLSITNESQLLVANTIGQTILSVDLNNNFQYDVMVGVENVAGFNGDGKFRQLNLTLANPQKAFKYKSLIYISDTWNQRIRVIDGDNMYTLIGDGECGNSKNGNDLKSFQLCNPTDVFVLDDIIYICDSNNHKIRKIQNGTVGLFIMISKYVSNVLQTLILQLLYFHLI